MSASLAIGALELLATSTKSIIFCSVVSLLSQVASIFSIPLIFVVPLLTKLPIFFKTGIDSPVKVDSSTLLIPSITFPSIGILVPGFTMRTSPTLISSTFISTSILSFNNSAILGVKSRSFVIACVVFRFERFSKYFPSETKVKIIPADSKYNSIWYLSINAIFCV